MGTLSLVAGALLAGLLGGCSGVPSATSTATSTTTSTTSGTTTARNRISPTPYSRALATAVGARGFHLSPAHGVAPAVRFAAAIRASVEFRPVGTPVAAHLALVSSPQFTSLDFGSASRTSSDVFAGVPAWLVVYHGEEDGTPGVWVVLVDATSGEPKAMVGFGAGLRGGAPCPNGRCIFE